MPIERTKIPTPMGNVDALINDSGHLLIEACGPVNVEGDESQVLSVTVRGVEYRVRQFFTILSEPNEQFCTVQTLDNPYIKRLDDIFRTKDRPVPPTTLQNIKANLEYAATFFVNKYPDKIKKCLRQVLADKARIALEKREEAKKAFDLAGIEYVNAATISEEADETEDLKKIIALMNSPLNAAHAT